jgi:hypothetical protein
VRTHYRYEGYAPASSLLIGDAAAEKWLELPKKVILHKNTCDVMFAPNVNDPDTKTEVKDEQGNVTATTYSTYISQFLNTSYFFYVAQLDDSADKDGYFTQMKKYLDKFYALTGEEEKTYGETVLVKAQFDENSLDKALVESEFRSRIRANKDKRFKKEEQITVGVAQEIFRIESYLKAYNKFFEYADSGYISFTKSTLQITEAFSVTGTFGINLCPDEQKMGGLKEYSYYVDFEGVVTAKNIHATFLSLDGLDKNFQYENLILINNLVESYSTDLR